VSWLKAAADAESIPVQLEVGSGGTTDATSIHLTKGGIPSTTLSIPARYIHSPVEVIDMKDVEAGVQLLVAALKKKPAL
jgi:endoglucanase